MKFTLLLYIYIYQLSNRTLKYFCYQKIANNNNVMLRWMKALNGNGKNINLIKNLNQLSYTLKTNYK